MSWLCERLLLIMSTTAVLSVSINQSIFICIVPNHNKVISRHFTHRAGSKSTSSGFNFKETQHSNMSNSGDKKLPINRKKPQNQTQKWADICLDRLGLRGEKGRIDERSTMKINNGARWSGTGIRHPDVYRPRLPVGRESRARNQEPERQLRGRSLGY